MIEPFRSATNRRAANVTTGSAAFLKAWRQITRRSGSPLMRASLTYSLPRTSSIDERVSRMSPATANQPSVIPGKSTCSGVPRPDVGSRRFRRHHDLDRIAREPHEREHHDRHHEHRHDRLDHPPDDEALHAPQRSTNSTGLGKVTRKTQPPSLDAACLTSGGVYR